MKKIISLSLSAIIFFVLNSFVSAQTPVLLKDINKVMQPTGLLLGTQSGSKFFFSRTTPENGWEIWITDGSVAGTHILKDIVPGPDSSVPYNFSPAKKAGIDIVYFTATTPTTGRELWVSDGTEAGTVLVEDISPGASSSDPQYLSVGPGTSAVIFAATTVATGREVWYSTDGTSVNTDLLFDVRPGASSSDPKDINYGSSTKLVGKVAKD